MLEKLLALLLHAKAGAISGTLLLGATGALISISAQNGVTTITVTQASPTPTAAAPSSSAPSSSSGPQLFVPAGSDPTVSTSPKPDNCADEAHAITFQVQRVDSAFKGFHTDLKQLRDTRSRDTLKTADESLKAIREAAVKAIHQTRACEAKKDDDEDEDKDEDKDEDSASSNSEKHPDGDEHKDKDKDKDHKDTGQAPAVTFTGTDPKAIADQAIAAMQTAFDGAKNAPATTPKAPTTHKPEAPRNAEPTRSPKPTHSR